MTVAARACLARSRLWRGQSPGDRLLHEREGGSERSTGSPGGPRDGWLVRRAVRAVARAPRSASACVIVALRGVHADPHRPLLRPLRLAGGRVPRGPGRDPLPGHRPAAATSTTRTCCRSPRSTASRAALIPFPPLPAVVLMPFVALVRAWPRRPGRVRRSSPRSTSGSAGGCSGGCRCASGCGSRRPPSSRSARSSGTRRSSARPGTRPTSSRSASRCSRRGSRSARTGAAVDDADAPTPSRDRRSRRVRRDGLAVDRRQFLVGLLFGLACTARLTMLFGGAVLRARRGRRQLVAARLVGRPRRGACRWSSCSRYNLVTTGQRAPPGLRVPLPAEATYYPTLGYNLDWAIEDPRYIPQNLGIMLFSLPLFAPDTWPDSLRVTTDAFCTEPGAARGLFDVSCPLAVPRRHRDERAAHQPRPTCWRSPRCAGSARAGSSPARTIAVLLVAVVNLMHFSQGWVQFGYRFSNDFVPWAVILVALGARGGCPAGVGRCSSAASSSPRSSSTPGESRGAICSDGEADHDRTPDRGRR